MITTSETQSKTQTTDNTLDSALPSRKPSRKSILALSVFALAINGAAAVYTLPSFNIDLPDVSGLVAELLPHERTPAPIPEVVVAALKDIQSAQEQQAAALKNIRSAQRQQAAVLRNVQSAQEQQAAALQENGSSLQQNAALLQQDSTTFGSLRQGITDEQVDVKKISVQLSTLITKVDSLQNARTPDITSSISRGRARARLSGAAYKRVARQPKPVEPLSVGGVPLTTVPAQGWSPSQRPEG
jgi:hypothetical protein